MGPRAGLGTGEPRRLAPRRPRHSLVVKHDVRQPDALGGDPQDVHALVAGAVPGQAVVRPLLSTRAGPRHSNVRRHQWAALEERPSGLGTLRALTCFSQTLVVMICSRSFWGRRGAVSSAGGRSPPRAASSHGLCAPGPCARGHPACPGWCFTPRMCRQSSRSSHKLVLHARPAH